jgi:hypothetical protein
VGGISVILISLGGTLVICRKIIYLNIILNIISIFIKPTTKLQGEKYPTIYYIIPKVYKIYNKLKNFKREFKVRFLFLLYY